MLALMSTAWLVPAFVGPLLGSTIAEVAGWRWTFLALALFVPMAAPLVLPAVAGHDATARRPPDAASWWRLLVPPGRSGWPRCSRCWAVLPSMGRSRSRRWDDRGSRQRPRRRPGGGRLLVWWIAAAWLHQRGRTGSTSGIDPLRPGLHWRCRSARRGRPGRAVRSDPSRVGTAGRRRRHHVPGDQPLRDGRGPGTEARATSSVQLANTIGAAIGTSALGGLFNAGRDGGLGMATSLLSCSACAGHPRAVDASRGARRAGRAAVTDKVARPRRYGREERVASCS